jgi:hypothetical protein
MVQFMPFSPWVLQHHLLWVLYGIRASEKLYESHYLVVDTSMQCNSNLALSLHLKPMLSTEHWAARGNSDSVRPHGLDSSLADSSLLDLLGAYARKGHSLACHGPQFATPKYGPYPILRLSATPRHRPGISPQARLVQRQRSSNSDVAGSAGA